MKFQVSNLFRKKEEPVENNAVETAEAQVAGEAPKAEPVTEQTAAAAEEEVTVCPKCKQEFKKSAIKDNYNVCIACGYHYVVSAEKRVRLLVDPGTFKPLRCKVAFSNPLDMPEYEEKIERLQEKTGLEEAVYTGVGKIDGNEAVIAVMSSKFLMGSMGMAVGEKVTNAVEYADKKHLPLIIFTASGGARMQEGILSLMQMAKTSAAIEKFSEHGGLYISYLTHPTTGGVTASFATLGDITLAEPDALIGFAGPRVIEQTIGQKLPEGFQRAEFQLTHGFVDQIVERKDQKRVLGQILKLHSQEHGWEKWNDEAENHTEAASASRAEKAASVEEGKLKSRKAPFSGIMRQKTLNKIAGRERDAWEAVRQSRSAGRLNASDYIRILFDDFTEFHGDRYYGDDMAVIGGVASFYGMPVTVIGQERGKSPKDSMKHNFGMPSPEGYRKALRLMKQAAKFNRPIICFVDTPGAFPGMEAEERGQGEAIARNLFEMSDMKVPILAIITGQGGSGGALALAVSNEVWMMENATYSILSPEGFASILWKDAKRASEAAKVMKMTAEDLYELGMIERIICEDEPATDDNIEEIGRIIDRHMREFFQSCAEKTPDEIAEQRYERFRKI